MEIMYSKKLPTTYCFFWFRIIVIIWNKNLHKYCTIYALVSKNIRSIISLCEIFNYLFNFIYRLLLLLFFHTSWFIACFKYTRVIQIHYNVRKKKKKKSVFLYYQANFDVVKILVKECKWTPHADFLHSGRSLQLSTYQVVI